MTSMVDTQITEELDKISLEQLKARILLIDEYLSYDNNRDPYLSLTQLRDELDELDELLELMEESDCNTAINIGGRPALWYRPTYAFTIKVLNTTWALGKE